MPYLVKITRMAFDGHYVQHEGTTVLLASDDETWLKFDPNRFYDGWYSNSEFSSDKFLSKEVLENPWTADDLHEEAGGTSCAQTACRVVVKKITAKQVTEYNKIIKAYEKILAS